MLHPQRQSADDRCAPPSSNGPRAIASCTLDADGMRDQADRYRRLGATAIHIEGRDGMLSATFGDELDECLLERTIAVARRCPFFGFDYQPTDRRLVISVQQPDQRPALDALHYALTDRKTSAAAAAR